MREAIITISGALLILSSTLVKIGAELVVMNTHDRFKIDQEIVNQTKETAKQMQEVVNQIEELNNQTVESLSRIESLTNLSKKFADLNQKRNNKNQKVVNQIQENANQMQEKATEKLNSGMKEAILMIRLSSAIFILGIYLMNFGMFFMFKNGKNKIVK